MNFPSIISLLIISLWKDLDFVKCFFYIYGDNSEIFGFLSVIIITLIHLL